jgi:hypothetical protein
MMAIFVRDITDAAVEKYVQFWIKNIRRSYTERQHVFVMKKTKTKSGKSQDNGQRQGGEPCRMT